MMMMTINLLGMVLHITYLIVHELFLLLRELYSNDGRLRLLVMMIIMMKTMMMDRQQHSYNILDVYIFLLEGISSFQLLRNTRWGKQRYKSKAPEIHQRHLLYISLKKSSLFGFSFFVI